MSKYTITPWRSQHDLLQVRSQLYGTNPSTPDQRRHAVDRVMAWKLRGNLPHAVESTALLIDAILHHSNPSNSMFSVRAVYSAAFTRFVTGFCDIGRNKERSLEPSSMLDIAKQIGMPVEFVALRHEATHEELPAVQRLVKAVDDGLQWLWTVYWSRLEEPESGEMIAASMAKVKADARQILRGFRSRRREAVQSRKLRDDFSNIQSTVRASVALFGKSSAKMEAFASVLVEDRLLSPSKRELGASLEGAFVIWDDLLKFINREHHRFAMALVKALLEAISVRPGEDTEKEACCMWVTHILHSEPWNHFVTALEKRLVRKDVVMWCCMHPGPWTQRLGRDVLKAEDEEFVCDWEDVFHASQLSVAGQDEDDAELGTWIRAATPFAAPIGVVR
ncbi:hypothetical protein M409DRAFT_69359 [Zasmidium cellare ATCC 36951]|uniref:Las1-like protein n=1 Tax=Zasmidium cellare ATCC 36951 TaxID=1080233 RepID=A0A6A6C924_ZASCE|nr:uncharacterized protein M409DRAFT_69359 [Zasmidium cellare ATCC 36951]KAF2162149.1 hypothetical protein M409DRAFT_69359 [Zasmidium cellare ATCC 36951]